MVLRPLAAVVMVAVFASACSTAGNVAPTATLGEVDGVVARTIPTSGVLGTSVADVSLPDVAADGKPMQFVGPEDGVLVVYFGYTFCPDVCPTTLADLRAALRDLGPDADRVEVAMATIDPGRDTAAVLTAYLRSFIRDGHPLRTEDDERLRAAADAFGVQYSVIDGLNGTTEVTHSAFLFAVDDTGEIRAIWPFGVDAATIAADIRELLAAS